MKLARYSPVHLPRRIYLGGQTLTPAASTALGLPSDAEIVHLAAAGGAAYYAINGAAASAASHGYIADGDRRDVGPLGNLNTMHVYSAAGTVHIEYYREG